MKQHVTLSLSRAVTVSVVVTKQCSYFSCCSLTRSENELMSLELLKGPAHYRPEYSKARAQQGIISNMSPTAICIFDGGACFYCMTGGSCYNEFTPVPVATLLVTTIIHLFYESTHCPLSSVLAWTYVREE